MFLYIIAGFIVLIFALIWIFTGWVLNKLNPKLPVELDTNVSKCSTVHSIDSMMLKKALPEKGETISSLFEKMCIIDPVKYKNNPKIPSVIKSYKDLIKGRIADPKAANAPSEYIDDKLNEDYFIYLRNQIKAVKKVGHNNSWFRRELKRVQRVLTEKSIKGEFISELMRLGIPLDYVSAIISEYRIENFKPEDWKRIAESIKEYTRNFEDEFIKEYLSTFDDVDILCNYEKMEQYNEFRNISIPHNILVALIEDEIDEDDVMDVITLSQLEGYSWEDAKEKVIKRNTTFEEATNLRNKYRKTLNRR